MKTRMPNAPSPRDFLLFGMVLDGRGQDSDSDHRRVEHRDKPGDDQRDGDHGEQRVAVLARAALGEADRDETRYRDQGAGQHGESGMGVGVDRGLGLFDAGFDLGHHVLDRDHRVVDQKPQCDDERPERDALQADARHLHAQEHDGQHQRNAGRDHEAGADAKAQETDTQHDGDRFPQRLGESVD